MSAPIPEHLIDVETGVLKLVLVPYHLERLHGPFDPDAPTLGVTLPADAPFPLLANTEPTILMLKGGMTREEIGPACGFIPDSSVGRTSWEAYAYTPFGWSFFPLPFFKNDRLSFLQLQCPGFDDAGYDVVKRFLVREVGSEGRSKLNSRGIWPFRTPREAARRSTVWDYEWGHLSLGYEPRDWTPLLTVHWKETTK